MTFELRVDGTRWRRHLDDFIGANGYGAVGPDSHGPGTHRPGTERSSGTPAGIVPVIKGNGYGFGRDLLCAEADRLGADVIAVGTYDEVPAALAEFAGDVMVLSPWRPFTTNPVAPESVDSTRVIHTLGRVHDVEAMAAQYPPGTRVLIEGLTSMERHGLDRHELASAVAALGDLRVEGMAVHLPLSGPSLAEADRWAGILGASQLPTTTLFISHVSNADISQLQEKRPDLTFRPRIGTSLWLGDLGALDVASTVIDTHKVSRGERIGYRQRAMPRDGHLLIVGGGTSHGVGLDWPRGAGGIVERGKSLARGGLEAAGLTLSPFMIHGRQRWFAEPPHMQASMLFLAGSIPPPAVGDQINARVRYTTAAFDQVTID